MVEKKNIYRLALFMAEVLMRNGGETYTVEKICKDFCNSKGYKNTTWYVTPTMIIMGEYREDGISFMREVKNRTINLTKVAKINELILMLTKHHEINIIRTISLVKKIDKTESYPKILRNFASALGSVGFTLMIFNIDFYGCLTVLVIAFLGLIISDLITKVLFTSVGNIIISTFLIGIFGLFAEKFHLANSTHVIVGSILPFLPGVAITKSVSDLVAGDLISGNARAIEACMTALSIGVGVAIALWSWQKGGGNLYV